MKPDIGVIPALLTPLNEDETIDVSVGVIPCNRACQCGMADVGGTAASVQGLTPSN